MRLPSALAWPKPRRCAALASALAVGALLSGCGGDDKASTGTADKAGPNPPEEVRLADNIVTDEQVAAQPKHSPGNALLRWWQSVQFRDVKAVGELTSSAIKREFGKDRLAELVRAAGPSLAGLSVVNSRQEGKTATLRVATVTYKGGKPDPAGTLPLTISMRDEQGEWRYDDIDYLRTLAKSY